MGSSEYVNPELLKEPSLEPLDGAGAAEDETRRATES